MERLEGELLTYEEVAAKHGWFWGAMEGLVGFVPSVRESREGRKQANQVRVVLVILAIGLMALGGAESGIWIVIGAAVAGSAVVMPISELRKRTLRAKYQRRQEKVKEVRWVGGEVRFDGRRLELYEGAKKVRHLLVDRQSHRVERGRYRDGVLVMVGPKGGAKKRSIGLYVPGGECDGGRAFEESDVDRPLRVEKGALERFLAVVEESACP